MTMDLSPYRPAPGRRILVVGGGRSGVAAALLARRLGAQVVLTDRGVLAGETRHRLAVAGVQVHDGGHRPADFQAAHLVVVSPGVPADSEPMALARAMGRPVIGELGMAALLTAAPMVAITGTNGKSTVTTLVGAMLAAAGHTVFTGGNLGVPLAEHLLAELDGGPRAQWLVLEVSSFQLDTVAWFAPRVAVLLNVSPDHLDRYPGADAYRRSKLRIFADQRATDVAVLNHDDPACRSGIPGAAQRRWFGGAPGLDAAVDDNRVVLATGDEILLPPALALGPNPANVAAAALAASGAGCPVPAIQAAVDGFTPLAHRMTLVAEHNGVRWVDDSKATNIGALAAALASLSAPVVLIAGGRDKGGDYRQLRPLVGQRLRAMVLIGEAAPLMAEAFSDCTRVERATDMAAAVRMAAGLARPGDVVLLSPACASFDMFSGYAERGRVFQTLVRELTAAEATA